MNQAARAAKRCPAPKFLGRWLRGTEYLSRAATHGQQNPPVALDFQDGLILFMEEIRRSPVEVGSLSHSLTRFCTSDAVEDFWKPTVGMLIMA